MRRPLTTQEYVLSALFALIAAFPLATAADGRWFSVEPLASLTPAVSQDVREGCHLRDVLPGAGQECGSGTHSATPQLDGLIGR